MTELSPTIEKDLTALAASPALIGAATAEVAPADLRARPALDAWSANDVLAHLRACADVWGDCIATILAQDVPRIRAVNPRTWINSTDYPEQAFQTSLRAFTIQRTDLLAVLESLPPEAWSKGASVTGAGKTLNRTLLEYAHRLARHEGVHVRQIEQIVKAMRR